MSAENESAAPPAGDFPEDDPFHLLQEKLSILELAQFISAEVCSIAGINAKQLEHAINPERSILNLSIHGASRIQGKRRLFTGDDVLQIVALFQSNAIGFPQRFAATLCNQVSRRAFGRLSGLDSTPNLVIATYPMKDGDWAVVYLHEGMTDEPPLPICLQLIHVDRLIDETLAKLRAVEADEPIPSFELPDPVPEPSLYSPENDFFRAWSKDEQGRNIRVGLNFEETEMYEEYARTGLVHQRRPNEDREKHHELWRRHEAARLERLSDTHGDTIKEAVSKAGK